jgi:hypothetical protein
LPLVRRFRLYALFCAFAVLACELVCHPFTTMGVADDGPYILIAQRLAATGHIIYNGPTTPILGWQLYLAAAFIKLFGSSFTSVRLSTVLVAMATAFVLQRTLVRANINERNATFGTLAFVLSPMYLMLSATFMTDIQGMFAVILCLYGCLRAVQSATSRAAIGWLCFAVATNAICGTSRQIAWLGTLVMVPSTLWLLRRQRMVLLAGIAALLVGALFIFGCMLWFLKQPYNVHERLLVDSYPVGYIVADYFRTFLDGVFLLLPITILFAPALRRNTWRSIALSSAVLLCYLLLAFHARHANLSSVLEPTLQGQWVDPHGIFDNPGLHGAAPVLLNTGVRVLLTIASLAALFGVITTLSVRPTVNPQAAVSWQHLRVLLAPYTIAYLLILIPRATTSPGILDRYLLGILFVPLLCLLRWYQERLHPELPFATTLLIGTMALYGICVTHNSFALYRARVALAAQLRADGVPDTAVDHGWEYNMEVELQHAPYLNDPRIAMPAHAYIQVPDPTGCATFWHDRTPHINPLYGVSFDPNACAGPAPFAPVNYSRWLTFQPGTLYVVKYKDLSNP